MSSNIHTTTTINAEVVPPSTMETHVLDQSEIEYDKMISQNAIYHRTMMEDLMKLSSESGSGSNSSSNQLDMIIGLGNTIGAIDTSNSKLVSFAQKKSTYGVKNAQLSPSLTTQINETKTKLRTTANEYDELMSKMQREGFETPTMDTMNAALGHSEIVFESQKYAFVLLGVFAIYLLHKTIKQL